MSIKSSRPGIIASARRRIDPGPAGDFFWKGLNWTKRTGAGSPQYNNGNWSTANIIGPDGNGYVTLRISNPSGNATFAAEMDSTRAGFGYGTYTITYSGRMDNANTALVFGGLFTYDGTTSTGDTAITHNEIDVHETSAWDSGGPTAIDHTYYRNVSGTNTPTFEQAVIPTDVVQTHRLIWSVGQLQFDSFSGASATGTPYFSTVATNQVPVPAAERLCINLWQYDAAGSTMPQKDIVLQDFLFVPA